MCMEPDTAPALLAVLSGLPLHKIENSTNMPLFEEAFGFGGENIFNNASK